jgi:hypothetical protein
MWTDENRARYDRSKLRYPSDLADPEWELVRPCIPRCKRGGLLRAGFCIDNAAAARLNRRTRHSSTSALIYRCCSVVC